MGHERIKLNDSTMDIVIKMAEGNPGAMNVIMQLLKPETINIDPDNIMGAGLGSILLMDTFGIYGTDIYILHNDICDRNIVKTIAVLRATLTLKFLKMLAIDKIEAENN